MNLDEFKDQYKSCFGGFPSDTSIRAERIPWAKFINRLSDREVSDMLEGAVNAGISKPRIVSFVRIRQEMDKVNRPAVIFVTAAEKEMQEKREPLFDCSSTPPRIRRKIFSLDLPSLYLEDMSAARKDWMDGKRSLEEYNQIRHELFSVAWSDYSPDEQSGMREHWEIWVSIPKKVEGAKGAVS